MEANFQRKVMIILKAYCFQLHEFSNENSLGTKIDLEFSCEKSLCSINDLKKLSEISLFICSSQTFPRIFWTKMMRWFFSAVISQCVSSTTNSCLCQKQSQFLLCEAIFFFFVGNSWLNCRIIESIFDTTLFTLTLTRLFTRTYACSTMLLMAAADSCHKNSLLQILLSWIFVWLPRKFATLNFAISRERSWIFRFKPYEKSFENSMTFRGKFARTKDEFRRISLAFCNFTVPVLARIWHATRHAKQKVWSVSVCTTKATVTSIVLLIKYAHMACCMSRSACRVMHACPCHHLFVCFPVDGHKY